MLFIPNRTEHLRFDLEYFGTDSYAFVHHLMDDGGYGFTNLFGKGHRRFNHDQRMVDFIYANYGQQAADVARAHIALDKVWSFSKRHGTKKQE